MMNETGLTEWTHAFMNIGQGGMDGYVGGKQGMAGTMDRWMVGWVHRWGWMSKYTGG